MNREIEKILISELGINNAKDFIDRINSRTEDIKKTTERMAEANNIIQSNPALSQKAKDDIARILIP